MSSLQADDWGRMDSNKCAYSRGALALAVGLGTLAAAWPLRAAPTSATHERDEQAMAALANVGRYLRGLPAYVVHANVLRDEVVGGDFNVRHGAEVTLTVRRPNKLRAQIADGQGHRTITFDGATLSVWVEESRYYATAPYRGDLRGLIDHALDEHGVDLPLLDVVYVSMGGELKHDVEAAGVIGPSTIDGAASTHYAYRNAEVDWQLWVAQGPVPVPLELSITTRNEPTRPNFSAVMRWDVAVAPADSTFSFSPPPGALPIALGHVDLNDRRLQSLPRPDAGVLDAKQGKGAP